MRYISIPFLLWLILSCSSTKEVPTDKKCTRYYQHGFSEIVNEKYTTINNGDTVSFHHIRFQCTFSAMYSHIAMYNKFGRWHKEIYAKNTNRPFLLWENIDLFSNGKQYTVYTFGEEKQQDTHVTVMVFDHLGNDLLSESSEEKEELTAYFATLIRDKKNKENAFVREYWKTVDPQRWEEFFGKRKK